MSIPEPSTSGTAKCGDYKLVDIESDHAHCRKPGHRQSQSTVRAIVCRVEVADPEDNSSDDEQHHDDWNNHHL